MSKQNGSIGHDHHVFPSLEVMILVLCLTVYMYSVVNLIPYVGIMVMQLMGLQSINEAGFYTGYMASSFMFGSFLSGYVIGYVGDKVGRKPVLIFSLLSVMVFSLAFGFSESFSWAIGSRLLLGMTNGIQITARTSLRELCGREHVVIGAIYMSGARPMSLIMGTGIGGLLATPALHYPAVFSPTGLFGRYPFLLPNVFGALFAGFTLLLVIVWYPETKGFDEHRGCGEFKRIITDATDGKNKVTNGGSFGTTFNGTGDDGTASFIGDVEQRKTRFCEWSDGKKNGLILRLFFLGCTVQTILTGFDEVFPLWMLSTLDVGGLAWNPKEIGKTSTAGVRNVGRAEILLYLDPLALNLAKLVLTTGILMGIIQFTVLSGIDKLVGIVMWYRTAWVLTVVALLIIPNAKDLSWNSSSLFAMGVFGNLLFNCCSFGILIALLVASTNSFPPQHRGKLSGLYNTVENLGRFVGPVGYSTVYALSISCLAQEGEAKDGSGMFWLDHHFVFYASAVLLALLAVIGWRTLTSEVLEKATVEESQ